jgi:hypothetical protein
LVSIERRGHCDQKLFQARDGESWIQLHPQITGISHGHTCHTNNWYCTTMLQQSNTQGRSLTFLGCFSGKEQRIAPWVSNFLSRVCWRSRPNRPRWNAGVGQTRHRTELSSACASPG